MVGRLSLSISLAVGGALCCDHAQAGGPTGVADSRGGTAIITPETCDSLWRVYRVNSPKTAAEISTIVSWCYLAAGEMERAHGLAELVLNLSPDADLATEARLIMARTGLSVCDRQAADALLVKAMETLDGIAARDAAAGDPDLRAEVAARKVVALRTQVSTAFVRRALLEVGIESVVPDSDEAIAGRLSASAQGAEQWWQRPAELWVDELPGVKALLPDRCPSLAAAPFAPRPARRPDPAVTSAPEPSGQQVVCEYPKGQSRRHAFSGVDIEPKIFRSWVGGILQGCTRHDPRELFASADEIRLLLKRYSAIARGLFPGGPPRDAIPIKTALPTFVGAPAPGDSRVRRLTGDPGEALNEAYRQQLHQYSMLFLAESSDRYPAVKRELASLECRYSSFLVGQQNEDAATQFIDQATGHYLEAANLAGKRRQAPAFLLEAGILARENNRVDQSCGLLQRLVTEFPGSNEAMDAHLLIAVSCLRHIGPAVDGKASYDLEKGAEHLKTVLGRADLRKRQMALYSLAMIRKDQGRNGEASGLLESVLKLFLSDKVVEWADETIHEYISACVKTHACDYRLIGGVNAVRRRDSGMYDLFKNSLAALDRFEFATAGERTQAIHALAEAASAASVSDEDRALIRLHATLEDVFVAVTDENVQKLGEALRHWAAFYGSRDASHAERAMAQARELLIKYVNDIILVRLWYLDADSFFGDLLGSDDADTLVWKLFDEVHRGLVYVGAHRQAVRSGLCYGRLAAFQASQLEDQLKSAKETRSNILKGVYWRKNLAQYDAVIERYHRKDYTGAEWDLRGKVLEYIVNSLQDRNPASLALYGKLRHQNLVRVEKFLKDALESGTFKGKSEDKYHHDLVVNYVGMSELAGDMGNQKGKQKYLDLAKSALHAYEKRHGGSEYFREAQNRFADVSVGIGMSGCKGIGDCVDEGDQMAALAQKTTSCSTMVRSHTRAAESYAKALAFAKAEEQWGKVCHVVETKCPADKLKKDGLDWESARLKCKTGGSRASVYLGHWDKALAQINDAMRQCEKTGRSAYCFEEKARIEAAAGRHMAVLKSAEDAVVQLKAGECSAVARIAALSAQSCFWSNDEFCLDPVFALIGKAAAAVSSKACKATRADARNLIGAQWYLGLAHWNRGREKGALDTWARCGGTPTKAAGVKDEYQLLCFARTYINRFGEAKKIFANVNDISTVNDEYLRLDREALKSVTVIRDASFELAFPDTLLALGNAVFVAFDAFADARQRLDPENKDIIENIRSSAKGFIETVSMLSGQLITHITGLKGDGFATDGLEMFFLPPAPFDLVSAAKFSQTGNAGLPHSVAKPLLAALLDRRYDAPFFLLDEWCVNDGGQYPKEVSAEACNLIGVTCALNGEITRAVPLFRRSRNVHPGSRGVLNYLLLASAVGDNAVVADICRQTPPSTTKTPLSAACGAPFENRGAVLAVKNFCQTEPQSCFGDLIAFADWHKLMDRLPKKLTTLQGSLK